MELRLHIRRHSKVGVKDTVRFGVVFALLLRVVSGLIVPSTIGTLSRNLLRLRTLQNSISPDKEQDQEIFSVAAPENHFNVPVLYESGGVLAIDKPDGVPHHDGADGEMGILSLLRQAQTSGNLSYQGRLYGVHRLDRVTSGILLLAKTAETASALTRAFREGNVTKYYIGVSNKKRSKKKQGWVKGNMVRGRRKSWYLTRDTTGDAKSSNRNLAVTRFFTASLASLRDNAVDQEVPPMTCILFRPHTGRTHQLRVAAKSVGLPLAGDPIYSDGGTSDDKVRTCLHASAIHIDLDNHEPITIWAPPPFHHLYKDDSQAQDGLSTTVYELMQKHCECDRILATMAESN